MCSGRRRFTCKRRALFHEPYTRQRNCSFIDTPSAVLSARNTHNGQHGGELRSDKMSEQDIKDTSKDIEGSRADRIPSVFPQACLTIRTLRCLLEYQVQDNPTSRWPHFLPIPERLECGNYRVRRTLLSLVLRLYRIYKTCTVQTMNDH